MSQPIILDDFRRQLKVQAAAAPWQAAGQAIQQVTQGIEQVLFDAQQRKYQEKHDKIAIMGQMVSQFGFKGLGPDFAADWEKETGVKFPRNPDGTVNIPETENDKVRARHAAFLQQHPELEGVDLGLMRPPMTTDEKYYKDQQINLAHERNMNEQKYQALEIGLRRAALLKDDGPSGWTIDKQTGKPTFVGFDDPKQSMTNRQVISADRMFQASRTELASKLEKVKLRLAIAKVKEDPQLFKLADAALKTLYNKKTDKREREIAEATLDRVVALGGPDLRIPEDKNGKKGFLDRFSFEWNTSMGTMGFNKGTSTTTMPDGDIGHKLSPEEEAARAGF